MGKLEIILLIGIPLISLIIVPNLAFGTHDEKLWLPGQTFPAPNDGNPIMDAVSFPIPIINKSPECTNKGNYNSPDCQKVSRYQITSFNNWETLGSVNLDTRCSDTARLQKVSKETITESEEESFLSQTQNTFEATWEVHADVKTTHTYESPEMYDAVAGTYTGQVELSVGGSYGETDTRMENFEHQTSSSFTLQKEEETTQELVKDASNKNIKWGQVQKFVQLKYDVWIPISVPDEDKVKVFPSRADPSKSVIKGTLSIPGTKTVIRDAFIYKAHDLPGDQYFVHTSYLLDAPTTLVTENFAQTGWYCDPVADGNNFDKRRIQQHVNPDYQKTYPKIHFKPEKHNWQIIVTDNMYVPISDATVKLGIHSFPIKSGGGVCTSTDREGKTDKWGAAFFYVPTKPPQEITEIPGLVSYWKANGNANDEFGDNTGTLENGATFSTGMEEQAFSLRVSQFVMVQTPDLAIDSLEGGEIIKNDSLDMTQELTIAAWVKPNYPGDVRIQVVGLEHYGIVDKSPKGEITKTKKTIDVKDSYQVCKNLGIFNEPCTRVKLGITDPTCRQVCTTEYKTSTKVIEEKGEVPNNNSNYRFFLDFDGKLAFWNGQEAVHSASPIAFDEFSHVAMTVDNGDVTFYINGEYDSSFTLALGAENDGPFYIGRDSVGRYFQGQIDNVVIFNEALSKQEIKDVRKSGLVIGTGRCDDKDEITNPTITVSHPDFETTTRTLKYYDDHEFWWFDDVEPDTDGDGVKDSEDNCPFDKNPRQDDTDRDNVGDVCEFSKPGDGNGSKPGDGPKVVIPSFIKSVAGYWCADEIGSSDFVQVIEWMIQNDLISLPPGSSQTQSSTSSVVPDWIQFNACIWYQEKLLDKEFSTTLQWLIDNGIIKI